MAKDEKRRNGFGRKGQGKDRPNGVLSRTVTFQKSKVVGGTQQRTESRRERAGPNEEQAEKGSGTVGIPADLTGANPMEMKTQGQGQLT